MLLPAELIDHIFSFLQKDTLALESCSKAHPLFSRLAERYLYAHIIINPEIYHLILKNPRFLGYPRTLEIGGHLPFTPNPLVMPVMLMIPRMANLVSLRMGDTFQINQKEGFYAAFRNCLQQSSIQQLSLYCLYDLPFSFLDDAKNIKHLTLSDCTTDDVEPISTSQVSLETLILSGDLNPSLHLWAARWVTRLTTLELQDLSLDLDWSAFPELLVACSNSLTSLHLDMGYNCYTYPGLPFTLSALTRLKKLSISALISRGKWALPRIIRVVNTAPAIPDVTLRFHCLVSDSITSLTQLDWSLLNRLQSNSTGKRPRIDLCVTGVCVADERDIGPRFSSESILDALAENEALMDLVKQGLVILTSEWED